MKQRLAVALPLVVIVAGCGTSGAGADLDGTAGAESSQTQLVEPQALTDPFFEYDRPAEHEVVSERVTVPTRDDHAISCELLRPDTDGEFPGIVYEYTAYADTAEDFAKDARYFVQRGYSALICQARGSGESEGELDPFGPQEQADNVDVIEWLAAQEHSTGKIGQMGLSYGGHTSLLAAVNQPPHLEAIIPINGLSDWYENTNYRGGIYSPRIGDWQRAVAPQTLETYADNPLHNDFWDDRSVASRWDRLDVPVLEINGWYDRYRDGMVKNHAAQPESVWMVSGPWEHGYPQDQEEPFDVGAYLAWWDHWLLDDDDAPLPQAKITSFELPGGGTGAGWTQFDEWPSSEVADTSYWLDDEGRLSTDAGAEGTLTYAVNTSEDASSDDEQIIAATEPLSEDLVVAGNIQAEIAATFSSDDGALAVIVEDVDESGEATRVTEGWLRASHRDGHEELSPVEPGEEYRMTVDVWPTHYRFAEGHSLQIRIASDDYPEIESSAPAGDVDIRTGGRGSTIHVPILAD